MATHSSIFAWEIPWTEKPGGLQSMGPRRVGHDLANNKLTEQRFQWPRVTKNTEFIELVQKKTLNFFFIPLRGLHSIPPSLPISLLG